MFLFVIGCEYGDTHGSAASFDRVIGHKVQPEVILALRIGSVEFFGCFIFEFPESSKDFFNSPPTDIFEHPIPLSYEEDKKFIKWRRTPFASEHIHFFEIFLSRAKSNGLQQEQVNILNGLAHSTYGLYAISYEDDGHRRSHNVDLFIIDTQTRKFYKFIDTNSTFQPNI